MPDADSRVVRLGATTVLACTLEGAAAEVMGLVSLGTPALVVTPNVDHLVLLERDPEFARAYERAALRVADGAPLLLLARLLGTPLPGRVTGVDLTRAVLDRAAREHRSVFFFGGDPGVLAGAVDTLTRELPALRVVGTAAPPVNLDETGNEEREALAALRAAAPDLLVMFLGTPKQEKWFWRRADLLPPAVGLAVGGTVDLIAGVKPRAPRWMQQAGLEWFWRLAHDPRRLAHRYLVQDLAFVGIAMRQLRTRRRG